ncbi:MAG: RsmB/NOP family class I SAM-dependent RNA methyltransferase [Candidatus Peribacteria bacterium]|jgi:16S rRNA (cytosine1407-C5)-methyltransferase|nr:RsmB/NOP family class I SAM-dependent RNA methyltransferase [Candidatus Peribacteria bacterium]
MKKISYVEMVKTLLPENEYAAFKHHYNKPLQKSIKILTSKTDVSTFSERVAKDGRTLKTPNFSRKGKYYDDVLLVEKSNKQSLGSHPLHQEGYFYVQEMAAGLAAQMLQLQPGDIVLDLCAAPGGKSIQLADKLLSLSLQKGNRRETTKNSGLLISNEPSPKRRKALQANLERCGIRNALITGYDGRQLGQLLQGQCDKVLLDAPCSGEGMQYKADCKIYQRNEKAVKKLAHLQKQLLIAGLNALKGGGELVYSTCTTNTIENEGVVASVLETLGDCVELMNVNIEEKSSGIAPNLTSKVARFRPHLHHTGGFFIAKFKRTSPNTSK